MKQFRRILCIVLCVVLLAVNTFCITAAADTEEIIAAGTCGKSLTWELDKAGILKISGTGEMSSKPWDKYKTQIVEVVVAEGVTSIARISFDGCAQLKKVTLPDSLTFINEFAFYGCVSLSEIDLPNNIVSIGERAFANCIRLRFIRLPDNLGVISWGLFYDCTALSHVVFGKNIAAVEKCAFYDCVNLQTATILGGWEQWCDMVIDWKGNDRLLYTKKDYHETHDYTETVHAPSCTERGYTEYYCAVCGAATVGAYTDALGHDFSGEAQRREPTCTENGEESRSCVRCGFMDTKTLPALGHDYKNGVCLRCGHAVSADFRDVPANAWYKDAVDYAVGMGLMNGVGGGKFAPEDSMTRAMLVTVLWRYAGSPTEGTNRFTDVPGGQWYTAAVAWAAGKGVVNGTSATTFEPDGNVTCEQMAAILYRYANSLSVDTGKRGDFTAFADANAVSGWAKDALSWTVAEGIIGGSKEGGQLLLNPAGNATRAQVAAILMRFIENVTK